MNPLIREAHADGSTRFYVRADSGKMTPSDAGSFAQQVTDMHAMELVKLVVTDSGIVQSVEPVYLP